MANVAYVPYSPRSHDLARSMWRGVRDLETLAACSSIVDVTVYLYIFKGLSLSIYYL
jgi:hypothetical protein